MPCGGLGQDDVVHQLVVLEDRPDRELVGGAVRVGHRHRIADGEAVVRGVVGEQRHLPVAQVVDGPLRDVHVEHPPEQAGSITRTLSSPSTAMGAMPIRWRRPRGAPTAGSSSGVSPAPRDPSARSPGRRRTARHRVVDRLLDRRRHGEQRDDGDADHQRRRRAGGAAGVAHGVALRQRPAHPRRNVSGPPTTPATGRATTGPRSEAGYHRPGAPSPVRAANPRPVPPTVAAMPVGDHDAQQAAHPRSARPVDGDVPQGPGRPRRP